ncbi:MAG TPA: DEAD/DEAH box helicase [Erysipelothrix sp.]|nr:DEAD/DEAH box helicase [Erysipelothrix sp.]
MARINEQQYENLLITNTKESLYDELLQSLSTCKSFIFNVAFISYSGLQLFINSFEELEGNAIQGKILTSTYLNFTEPKSLKKILEYDNLDLKLYDENDRRGFHNKGYIFEYDTHYKVIIGSSNITANALKNNIEWNVKMIYKKQDPFLDSVFTEFNDLWDELDLLDAMSLDAYEWKYYKQKEIQKEARRLYKNGEYIPQVGNIEQFEIEVYRGIEPNSMQQAAMNSLANLRDRGKNKALIIAATATGKTFLSAFDVQQFKPKKALFVVHRENILMDAMSSFKAVLGSGYSYSMFTGNQKDDTGDIVFSTNISLANNLELFEKDQFDYIIVDEAHHASATTYQSFINYFKPQFLLGMTASPERGDQASIFSIFDHNIALEVRLEEAINSDLIVPFHYFGVTDAKEVDLSNITQGPDELSKIATKLMIHSRTQYIIQKMDLYGFDGTHRKGLGFCVNLKHAEFMSKEFNAAGIVSEMISGNDTPEQRKTLFNRLEDNNDPLEMLFSVDVLNEGIDIPAVNLVLMLRPTNSPVIFLQQLGRGLRKHKNKEFLTVLDFIANYSRSFLLALALTGNGTREKDSTMVQVDKNFNMGPKKVFIQMDEIVKEQILDQLKQTNFNTLKYLKEEYNSFKLTWLTKQDGTVYIPRFLMDYYGVDKAPDPSRFIKYDGNYLRFVNRMENDEEVKSLVSDDKFMKLYTMFNKQLPLIRPIDFIIYREVLTNKIMSHGELIKIIREEVGQCPIEWFEHSLKYINFELEDSVGKKNKTKFVQINESDVTLSPEVKEIVSDSIKKEYIEDVIEYGLLEYYREFGRKYYGNPFLKLHGQYSMQDVALAGNLEKMLSSFRGQGVTRINKDYFLFVDLHKDADIQESINYQDKILTQDTMQWESQNITSQKSATGKNMINHKTKGYNLHMFVRKQKELDGQVLPYEYLGLVDVVSYKGNKPITFQFKLHNKLSYEQYQDFITKI